MARTERRTASRPLWRNQPLAGREPPRLRFLVLVLLVLASATLIGGWSARRTGRQVEFVPIVSPAAALLMSTSHAVMASWQWCQSLWWDAETLRQLAAEKRQLEQQVAERQAIEMEVARLQHVLQIDGAGQAGTLAARVLQTGILDGMEALVVGAGGRQGLARHMPVIGPGGLVGQVVVVLPESARVLLISDVNSKVGALVPRSGVRGIVTGAGHGRLALEVKTGSDVQPGDVVCTSGEGSVFPSGLALGTVEARPLTTDGLVALAPVRPAVDVLHVEDVLVVQGDPAEPVTASAPAP